MFNDKTSEVEEILKTFTEPIVEEASEVPAEVTKLRAEEQAEMLEQVPGAENALTDGKVDNIDYIDETLYNKNVSQTPEGTEFINVYRAEGKVVNRENLPLSVRGNAGSWFTPFKAEVERYAAMGNRKVYKIAIPKALYDNLLESRKGNVAMSKGEIQLPRNISSLKTEVSKPTQQTSEVEAKKTKSKTKSQAESKTKEIADVVAERKKEREKYKEDSDKNFEEREKIKDDKNLSKEEKQKKIKALEAKRDKIKNSYEKKNNELGDKKNKLEKERESLEKKYKKESKSEESKRSQEVDNSEVNSETIKNKIRGQIKNAIKALSKIAKGVTIEVYETQKEYEASGGDPTDGGEYSPSTKTIKINLEKANLRTVAHEVFHAILLKDGITNEEARRITSDMLDAVRRIASPKLLKQLDAFASKYTNGLQSEESVSELFGILAENYETSSPVKKLINEWLRKLAKVLNIPIKGMLDSDKDIIEFLSVVSQKVARGEVIEQSDIALLQEQEQGSEGEVGTIKIPRQQITVIDAPDVKDDPRDWIRKFVEYVDINEFDLKKFITNMYDYTNAGKTDLGNGYSIELLGGRNYVPLIMYKMGKILGEVSNLAAFNTKSQAEGFVRNALEGEANMFAPHSGTLDGSWQFQQHIFEQLVDLVLDNNILTNKEIIKLFDSNLRNESAKKTYAARIESIEEKGFYIKKVDGKEVRVTKKPAKPSEFLNAFRKFRNNSGLDIKNLDSFESNPKELVRLLNIKNNFGPDLRKNLNQKIAANKKFQEAIGVKSLNEFHQKIIDPLNKGIVGAEIMTFIQFDPTTFEIVKTNPSDVDHHPSFGWTVKAKIERIMQPTKFYKSYDITESYTKYNSNETVVSRKTDTDMKSFKSANVSSAAGAIVKVAEVKIPETRQQIIGENADLVALNLSYSLMIAKEIERIQKLGFTERIKEAEDKGFFLGDINMTPEQLKYMTGWERGKDNKWRYEIQDGKLTLEESGTFKLSDIYDSKDLYIAYPQLKDMKVKVDIREQGANNAWFIPSDKSIEINAKPNSNITSALVHEIQHAVQFIEGFATGGNMTSALEAYENTVTPKERKAEIELKEEVKVLRSLTAVLEMAMYDFEDVSLDELLDLDFMQENWVELGLKDVSDAVNIYDYVNVDNPGIINKLKIDEFDGNSLDLEESFEVADSIANEKQAEYSDKYSTYGLYQRLAGEVESRNVEKRFAMTEKKRRETLLEATEDVAREDQILLFPDAPETRRQKATPLTDELIGLNESEIIKQGYLEFFSSMKDKAEDADFIYSEFVEEALDRMQSKINRIRETFKNKISRNKEARKEVRKQIAEILKNSGLDSISKRAIKSIMKNIENATPATMQKKVAEVMDVISRDIKRQARYNRKKTLGKALSNIGKIGSLKELNNILVDALKINPQYLSDKTLVKYDKIISSLASVSKKFDMPSRIELKSLAEAVITSFQADYKLAQEIIRDRINNNLDPSKSVLENLNQMKKENKITDSEFELLVRFKDQINETKKENVSAEDKAKTAQERRSEATEDFEAAIQGIPKSFKDLNDDERSVLRIVKTLTLKDLENLTTNEIQKLVRGLEGLMAGYIGSDLIQSVDTIKADRLSKNTATGETLERGFIDKLLTRAKTTIMNIFRARDKQVTPIMERIRSTPLKNIDQILNDAAKGFKSTKIYENIFRPTGVAFEAASKKLKMAKKDLDRAGAFLDIGRNKRYAQKVKIMIYQIQREYDSNGGKKANAELVTAISMINHTLKDPLVDLSDRERAAIEKIRDEYLSIDGEIDADKIFNSFTDKEKKSLALIDKVYSDIQEMARMDAARQGLPFVLRKNYVHLPRITKGQNTMTSEEEFEALADNFSNPVSMKSKALFQRNGKPHSISFDPIYNANAISRKATVSYYMVPAVKIGKRVLANLKANAKTDYQKDLFNSLEEVYDSIIRSEYKNVTKDRAFIEKALSFLGRSGYLAQLAGPIKAAVELASNATHAILYNPIAFNEGFQILSKVPKDTINKALNNVYSTQTARLTENEGGSKDIEERLYASAPLFQQEQMTSDFGDRIGKVFSVLKKPAKAFMKFNEDLITKPDYLVAKPLFIGAFSASFEESTGQKPNWEKIANDEEYRNKFDSAIQKASEDGDAAVIDNAASNNPFDAIPKNILDRDASAIKQALQTVNRYMSRFRTFEYYSALKGVQSMIGKGDLTKSQGALLLTATVIRMSMYKMAIDMAFSVVFSLLGLDDEDDEKEIDEEVSKGVLGAIATLALGRYLGNVAQMPVNYGTEWLNREYGEGITFSGVYNAYKDGIVFSKIPMEVKPQDNMISNVVINSLGSYTPMVKTVDRAGKLITRATASKRQETRDRNLDELLTRIPFEIAGNSGVIPGYKTLRKIYNKYLFGAGENAATSKPNKTSSFTGPKLNKSTVPKLNKSTVPKLNKSTVPKLNK
jgi:hypothetical protein